MLALNTRTTTVGGELGVLEGEMLGKVTALGERLGLALGRRLGVRLGLALGRRLGVRLGLDVGGGY